MYLTNFIFTRTFFLIASYKIIKNYVIPVNHGSFFQEAKSSQLYRPQFLKINSLMTESIQNEISKTKFLKTIFWIW